MINDVSDAFRGWQKKYPGEHQPYDSSGVVTPDPFTFKGVIQNATGDDLKVLPEGLRGEETIKIHTKSELTKGSGNNKGDLIIYKGFKWLVYFVAERDIGNYNKAIAIKQPRLVVT